jgi:iron complex transport system substrate-binding protein
MVLIITSIFAGCIENIEPEDEETIPIVSEILTLNQTKTVTLGDSNYNFTLTRIDDGKAFIIVNSMESPVVILLDNSIEIDSNFDGVNDLEINITNITSSNVSIKVMSTTTSSDYNYILDDTGKTVKVPKKIKKIVSMAPSITEILFNLNMGDKVVGRDSASNYPEGAKDIEIVSTYEGVDIEKILVIDPDIILMDKTLDISETSYNKLIDYGLRVFRIYPRSLNDVLENIKLIGHVTGTETRADEIVNELQSRIDVIKTRESGAPMVLHIIYYDGSSSPWVATSSTFSGDLIQIANGKPAVIDDSGISIQITVEQLINLNPDIIFTSQDQTWPTPSREAILNDNALKDVTAVKNNKVIDVNADLVDRPGPRLVDGLELISNYIIS